MAKITISTISVQNLGPFHDQQSIDLTVTATRPVILVKALNGSGKTTLLTALQVGLYGHKALIGFRRSEYDQLMQNLQRKDALGNAVIEIKTIVEVGDVQRDLTVRREWTRKGSELVEKLTVFDGSNIDHHFTLTWDEFIGSILPAELVQLFLFDGEKIEALANPERLPDLLKRATEVFLGIGGIESLANDLRALERRTLLKNKKTSSDFDAARANLHALKEQADEAVEKLQHLTQDQAAARNALQITQTALDKFTAEAQRGGLSAYEQAAEIRTSAIINRKKVGDARANLVDAISNPTLPLAWLPNLWNQYSELWEQDQNARHAKLLVREFKKRDQRVMAALQSTVPEAVLTTLHETLLNDRSSYGTRRSHRTVMQDAPVKAAEQELHDSQARIQTALTDLKRAQVDLDFAEQRVGQVPAEEQVLSILEKMQYYSKNVSVAEAHLGAIVRRLEDTQGQLNHIQTRLAAAQTRLGSEFRDQSLEAKSLEASARARKTLSIFKERLLASKAKWLSEMITVEFRNLLRKRNFITKVLVDPVTYQVSIEDRNSQELPMDRLSAGERQLLAISVLSALIKERKGRFPVVVDTPLARLDQQHRTCLIKRFFATVSHQVVILSTDQEVDGVAYTALKPFTNAEYSLDFDDATGCSSINNAMQEAIA